MEGKGRFFRFCVSEEEEVSMRKAFKHRLYPNKEQEHTLFWTLTRCRELYNAALSERRDAYRIAGKSVSYYAQKRDLPEVKAILRPEYQGIHSQVLQDVLLRLDKAFKAFFRRVANGEKPGYPRFQGRNRYTSFTYPQGGYSLSEQHVTFSKIGTIKIKLHRPIEGKIKTCTIKYEAGQWYCVFSCECEVPEPLPTSAEEIGIDLGLLHFAALSDGTFVDHPCYYRKVEKTLARRQQVKDRRKRGSHRREKARMLVAKAHRKICNQRRDFLHKQSRKLVKQYQTLVFEALQTENLVQRPKPKQECSHKELDEQTHLCPHCGVVLDRDTNAALNILRLGRSQQSAMAVEAPVFRQGVLHRKQAARDEEEHEQKTRTSEWLERSSLLAHGENG